MDFIKRLFGNKNNTSDIEITTTLEIKEEVSKTKEVPISEVKPINIPESSTVVFESSIPEYCSMGNLIYEKKYNEAIGLGLKLLEDIPNDTGVLINLMVAYFKGKEATAQDYLVKSSYYAKQAMLNGHNTGYAEERLAKNLDKAKLYHQSLQLYNLILETDGFHFSSQGCGNFIDWNHRRDAILNKMDKAMDTEDDILFTPKEIAQIIKSIKDKDDIEIREKKRHDSIMAEIGKAMKDGDWEKCDALYKELHRPLD